jgi:hypothetical protein
MFSFEGSLCMASDGGQSFVEVSLDLDSSFKLVFPDIFSNQIAGTFSSPPPMLLYSAGE